MKDKTFMVLLHYALTKFSKVLENEKTRMTLHNEVCKDLKTSG